LRDWGVLGENGTEVVVKTTSHASKSRVPDVFDVLDACHRDILGHLDKLMALISRLEAEASNEKTRSEAREVIGARHASVTSAT
jgi:hypothetical protein